MPKKQESSSAGNHTYELPVVPCCFALCRNRATMRIRTNTGWANVCAEHDIEIQNRETKEWLAANGLTRESNETVRDWASRVLAHVRARREPRKFRARPVADLLPAMHYAPPELVQEALAEWTEVPVSEEELEVV